MIKSSKSSSKATVAKPSGKKINTGNHNGCSLRCFRRFLPATEMSAPESGRACTVAWPLREDMWTAMVGAGSKEVASVR